jgi:ATPase subunit of ABC transporter with duplicated ATPase domains
MPSSAILSGVSFAFPNGRQLFSNLNLSLETKLYSLVGPNGVGKTTLAKLLTGELQPSSGRIQRSGTFSFLVQRETPPDLSVSDYIHGDTNEVQNFNFENEDLIQRLIDHIPDTSLCSVLSEGQWMRVRLAKAIRSGADFLILDEPTNDLDRDGREAVLVFLRSYDGGVLLISHDRELLEISEEVIEISNRGPSTYGFGWKAYLHEKQRERSQLAHALEKTKIEREKAAFSRTEKTEKQNKRNRRGAEAAARGGMPKILLGARKRQAQVSSGRIDAETSEKAQKAVSDAYEAYSSLKLDPVMYADLEGQAIPTQKLVVEATEFNIRYLLKKESSSHSAKAKWLYAEDLNFAWRGNIRIAIKGSNGSGKSSLLKVIATKFAQREATQVSEIETRGKLVCGKLRSLFIDQRLESIDGALSVFENVRARSNLSDTEIRNGLAKFLFTKTDVFQQATELSGGERIRLALAQGFLSGELPELVILDEPTNNLDLANIEFLEKLLSGFKGALIAVSHDDVFLKNAGIHSELMCSRGEGRGPKE